MAIEATDPALSAIVEQVRAAAAARAPLAIRGGGTKDFYGEPSPRGTLLDTRALAGVSSYEPTELVVTARCGTPLVELESLLATKGQCLPFEPPHFGEARTPVGQRGATVGGMVGAGLAGPARAAAGSVRDFLLGATMLNGRAEVLSFGGQVMKNVAGYDVSRLLAGSLGVLGVILEVSLKVLPVAPATSTLRFEMAEADALTQLARWGGQPLPLNASAWCDGKLVLRLSGAEAAVRAARLSLGGEIVEAGAATSFWDGIRHQDDAFFSRARQAIATGATLWRLSVPQTAPPLGLSGEQMIEWAGGQRWLASALPAAVVHETTAAAGGHATLFRNGAAAAPDRVFAPLKPPLDRIHRELKRAFDPEGIFNPGRLYPDL